MKYVIVHLVLLLFTQHLFSAEILIQTGDEGTTTTGNWYSASGASMPINGNRGRYAIVGGPVETYHFQTSMPETTSYTLQVFNTCYSPRSRQVTQRFIHNLGSETFVTDQDCQSDPFVGQWRTLGTYELTQGEQVEFIINTENSNNNYVGASAIRFTYNETTPPPTNTPPTLTLSAHSISVNAQESFTLSASANDLEDGNLNGQIQWSSPLSNSVGESFSSIAGSTSFTVNVSVTDSAGETVTDTVSVTVNSSINTQQTFNFGCLLGPLNTTQLTVYNGDALPNVGSMCNRYTAQLTNNDNNQTLFFHNDQGRLDGTIARFPFEAIARNVGIAPVNQPDQPHVSNSTAYNFVGLHIHHIDFNNINSTHLVVGQRGNTTNTIEGKKTFNGQSNMNDIGHNQLPLGRADIRLVLSSTGQITAYWQLPNLTGNPANDDWTLYRGTGELPGEDPDWGQGNQVIVGLITYSYWGNGIPFWGVVDKLEINEL